MKRSGLSLLSSLLVILLTAGQCSGPAPRLVVEPDAVTVTAGASGVALTAVVSGTSGAVDWTLDGPGSLSPESGPSTTYTPPSSVAETASATLTASLGALSAEAAITITPASVTTGSLTVTIDGLPSGTEAAVTVTGPEDYSEALTASATLTNLTLGSYTVTAEPIPSGGDSYTPNPASQTVEVSAGATTSAAVSYSFVQSQFFVNPVSGADKNAGSADAPFKTLKHALSVVQSGQTVILYAGTYDGASGEDFGYTVPEGVTLKANSSGVMLVGLPSQNALTFAGDSSLQYLTFKGFATALTASSGSQALTGLAFEGNRYDLAWSGQAAATLQDCTSSGASYALQAGGLSRLSILNGSFSGAERTAVVQQSAVVSFDGTTITGGLLDAGGSSYLSLTDVELFGVDSYAVYVRDSSTQLRIQGGSFHDNTGNASVISSSGQVTIDGASFSSNATAIGASAGTVTISNASIVNNSSYGVALGSGVAFKLRNSRVAGNAYGIYVSDASGGIDLGTASDPGGNTLQDNRNFSNSFGYNLGGGWSGVVQAVGNTWQANLQGSDAAGHYASQLLTCPGGYPSLTLYNFYCSSGSQIQY